MTQRLILLFDGTWNDPEDQTNVYRITRRIQDCDGATRQHFFYDPGVGTSKLQRFSGGVFGYGLSTNLLEGYEWLARRYREGEEIWIFGFSRGAYTARSLVGLIRKCGLLHIVTPCLLEKAESIYRNDDLAPDSEVCRAFRKTYSRTPRIHFIGVWDTVGALGVPGTVISERGKYAWHDTELSSIVDRAYHAVALDEHRATYDVPLWTSEDGRQKPSNLEVEQRWFIGAHANVGGGYGSADLLPDISLQWMMGKAEKAGLKLEPFTAAGDAWKTEPRDSFKEFLRGAYAWFQGLRSDEGDGRFSRRYSSGLNGLPAVNISVDESVWKRWRDAQLDYRPRTLTDASRIPPEL
ncbi:DUF2235 domain-containing protein [Halopseudomonas sp.]|uniref:DUF2235 domain-containing protein n=1 Tax=Halopseudomonas sp. TaxID=2901191 RepID=UPI0035698B7D